MTLRKGLPAKLASTDADDTRYVLSGLIVGTTAGVPRGGVLSPVGTDIVTATATMNVSVARFQAAAIRDAGVVLLSNDGATKVLLDAAPAANSRLDVIWAKQNDASSTVTVPDANNLPVLGFTKGAAGAVPVKPTIPADAVELAVVEIPSTAIATDSPGVVITQSAQFTAAAGGVVTFRTKAALDLWITAAVGQRARVLDVGYLHDGSAWVVFEQAGPRVKHVSISTGTIATGTVLGTFTIPRRDYAQRVVVDMSGYIAPVGAAGNCGVNLTVSAGGTVVAAPTVTATVPNGAIGSYARKGLFDVAVGGGADVVITLTLTVATTATTAQVSLISTANIYPDGQF